MSLRRQALLVPFLAAGVIVTGCGETVIDANKAEAAIRFDVQEATKTKIDSVECPEDVEVVPGTSFSCKVVASDGAVAIAEGEILNDDADVRMIRLTRP